MGSRHHSEIIKLVQCRLHNILFSGEKRLKTEFRTPQRSLIALINSHGQLYYSSALVQYYDSPDYGIVFVFAQSASDQQQQQRVESIHSLLRRSM